MTHPELPQDIDAERAVLGSILINREALVPIAPWLKDTHFYLERHVWIYAAMLSCYHNRTTPNTINVLSELRKADRVDAIGGIGYLSELVDVVPSSYDVEAYARTVEECATLRGLIAAGGKIAAIGYDRQRGGERARADAQQELNRVHAGGSTDVLLPLSVTIEAYYDKLERVKKGEASALGTPTGYRDLDEITGGLHNDELTIIAARPAVGKTSFLLSLTYNIASQCDRDVLIYSLEMSREQLLIRLIAMDTKIDTHRLRTMHLTDSEAVTVMEALGRLDALPIYLADISAMTTEQIRLAALRHLGKHDRPILPLIDYLQLMGSTRQRENRVQDVSEISRSLKNLSRELHIPVISLSQLSRAVEGRTSHVPMLSDLRESGSLEQDADNVWFIYREELYDRETDKLGIAELHIAKHRNGPVGVIPMRFDAATTRFDTLTYRDMEGY